MDADQYEQLGPGKSKMTAIGPSDGGQESKKPQVLPARTPGQTVLGQFALREAPRIVVQFGITFFRPGDDVDLSSERATTVGSAEGITATKKSKSKEDVISGDKEKEREKPKAKTKPIQIDIKPYVEPTMLKMCHAVTLTLLVISFVLMALTVVQFVDIFVWLPILFGDEE
ncbi:hypothetical protein OSTOST_08345 [Ostertagia ostertagi]